MTDTTEAPAGAPWLEHDRRLTRLETLCESLATRTDLEKVRGELGAEIQKVRGELAVAIQAVRGELGSEIQKTRVETQRMFFRMIWVQIAGFVGIAGLVVALFRHMGA